MSCTGSTSSSSAFASRSTPEDHGAGRLWSLIGAIAELERNLIVKRVRAGMRRARLEGRHIGRKPLELDRNAILRDREWGKNLGQLAKSYRVSRATIHRVLREHATTTLEKSV
jgi:DNA invertase Pin-like site-specific DNA recombinase